MEVNQNRLTSLKLKREAGPRLRATPNNLAFSHVANHSEMRHDRTDSSISLSTFLCWRIFVRELLFYQLDKVLTYSELRLAKKLIYCSYQFLRPFPEFALCNEDILALRPN